MILPYRQMQPRDVPECVDIVASNPVLKERYGAAISALGEAWLRLLGNQAFIVLGPA